MQIQPYMQLMLTWNVKQVISAIKARVSRWWKGGKSAAKKEPSDLVKHRKRKKKCMSCVNEGMAFCDRRVAMEAMSTTGFKSSMDECMRKTKDEKNKCTNFEIDGNASWKTAFTDGDSLFKGRVCPCYDRFSGEPLHPHWITDEAHCKELEWPGKGEEENRKHQKFKEWTMGFSKKDTKKTMLDDTLQLDFDPGCNEDYRCCNAFLKDGSEALRCMFTKDPKVGDKCKWFEPLDVIEQVDGRWHHMHQEFRCSKSSPSFQGHWIPKNPFMEDRKGPVQWVKRQAVASADPRGDVPATDKFGDV